METIPSALASSCGRGSALRTSQRVTAKIRRRTTPGITDSRLSALRVTGGVSVVLHPQQVT